ncbi:uncharacterized protein LOC113027211 [Astatotilapia calliptera]|uniref:uncharacterized protein LOC113027211 n=1 Tax=Astatotilapia calliptera TaxID=8154 RepID=UPI000E421531|nr:uncharacterized protein LOC113027211 [Astatotilapia calliptera]
MAAGFLIARLLLVCLLSEVNYSSAFPRARSFVQPRVWQSEGEEEAYNYENCHPFYYISAQDKTLEKQGRLMMAPFHICKQNHPIVYQKASNLKPANPLQPRSNVATKWPKETVLPQPPPQKKYLSPKPKSYEFSLSIPYFDLSVRHEGGDLASEGHDGGNDTAPVSKPGFQIDLSVASSSVSQYPNIPMTSYVDSSVNQENPENTEFVNYGNIKQEMPQSRQPFLNSAGSSYSETQEPAYKPYSIETQSSSTLTGSERPFLHFQTQEQTYEPVHVKPQSSTLHETERPFFNFETTPQQTFEPSRVKPQSNSPITGSEWPFFNSAATQQQTHEPGYLRPQSISTLGGSEWPALNLAPPRQQSFEAGHLKPQASSAIAGSEWPVFDLAPPRQQTFEAAGLKPQSSSTLAGSEWPALNLAPPRQRTFEPGRVKPQSSSAIAGSEWPTLNMAPTLQQASLHRN